MTEGHVRVLTGRGPRPHEVAFAIVARCVLIGSLVAIGIFDAGALAVIIHPAGQTAGEALLPAAVGGAVLGIAAGTMTLPFIAAAALDARRPSRRAVWLRHVAEATRVLSIMATGATLIGLGLMLLAFFAMPLGLDAVAWFAGAMLMAPAAVIAARQAKWQMKVIAVRTLRWARSACPRCKYNITGLSQCPECGAAVWRAR